MSYDLDLLDPVTGEVLGTDAPHMMAGGIYELGGTTAMTLNVTYNYGPTIYKVMNGKGLRDFNGMPAAATLPLLKGAIAKLGNDTDPDYWRDSEGNVKRALIQLQTFAAMRPDGVWRVI